MGENVFLSPVMSCFLALSFVFALCDKFSTTITFWLQPAIYSDNNRFKLRLSQQILEE